MAPTINGRIQTRIFLVAIVGSIWTALITLALPGPGTLGEKYRVSYSVLLIVLLLGLVWEMVYHGLQQFRWEKDWPGFFGLIEGIPEGIVAWFVAAAVLDPGPTWLQFLIHFGTTWIVLWLFVNGPIRVVNIRWRMRGGRFI
jgi:hypothetical protein